MVRWTDRQQKAINAKRGECVVSASAGTGKTSVLIERVWEIVNRNLANIDECLIVTFTEKAAAELKARLHSRLQTEFESADKPERKYFLLNQLNRLDRAQVSTIHSFCLRVIRENYQLIDLNENVDVIPSEQLMLIKHRVIDDIFEQMYADKSATGDVFREFANLYGDARVDENLKYLIISLNSFLETIVNPQAWIDRVEKFVNDVRSNQFDISAILQTFARNDWLGRIENIRFQLTHFQKLAVQAGAEKIEHHIDDLLDIMSVVKENLSAGRFDVSQITIARTPQAPKNEIWADVKDEFAGIKKSLKDMLKDINSLASVQIDDLKDQLRFIEIILTLLKKFRESIVDEKRRAGLVDYDDILQIAYKLLSEHSAVAQRYRQMFKFVMVDEYQDINELQDAIIRKIARPTDAGAENLFVVGDVKQSIYRFRLAEPEIFQSLCKRASETRKSIARIDLRDNFRSRQSVIDTVNSLFELLMVGGQMEIEYDESHKLIYQSGFSDDDDFHRTELHIVERKIEASEDSENILEEYEANEREAYFVAQRIEELLASGVEIFEDGQSRPIQPDDIVILLRTMKNTASQFAAMLQRRGIAVSIPQLEAFTEYPEIADMVSLLKIIDNPYQDIPLVSVLRSPMVRASAQELSKIRLTSRGYFFAALERYVEDVEKGEGKFSEFLTQLKSWREFANRFDVAELIQKIYVDTGYPDYASLPQSSNIVADNLNQFLQLAREFVRVNDTDVSDFVEYIELMSENELNFSGVSAPVSSGVRIMSIHSAKGLEFPVVILANTGKKFNMQDIREKILFDREFLVSLQQPTDDGKSFEDTLIYAAIKRSKAQQIKAEELRLLYVALTRAKEKLIITGNIAFKDLFKAEKLSSVANDLSGDILLGQNTFLHWLVLALTAHQTGVFDDIIDNPESEDNISTNIMDIYFHPQSLQEKWAIKQRKAKHLTMPKVVSEILSADTPKLTAESERMISILEWKYPQYPLTYLPAKISVTEFTRQGREIDDSADPMEKAQIELPDMETRVLSPEDTFGIEKGIAWHKFMEKINLNMEMNDGNISAELERMTRENILTDKQKGYIDIGQVKNFFRSEPGRLMLEHSDRVRREQEFTYLLAANSLPDALRIGNSEEPVLVRGVIDSLILLNDGLVIIDYKTSQIQATDVAKKVKDYHGQVELYARAMSEILNKPAKSVWLYFTEPDSAVQVI